MNWLHRAEQRFGHLAIQNLPFILVGFNLLVYVLSTLNREFLTFVVFDPELILQGQVWRLFTFLFIPSYGGLLPGWIAVVFYLLFLYYVSSGLERAVGAFRLTIYYALGCLAVALACFLLGANPYYVNVILQASVFLAFARFYGDNVIYIFFVLPVKVKWLAWLEVAWLILLLVTGDNSLRLTILAGMVNYFIFFGRELWDDARQRRQVAERRARFERDVREGNEETLHQCHSCGRTEITTPELEFRVARDGHEYCVDHLPKPPTFSAS